VLVSNTAISRLTVCSGLRVARLNMLGDDDAGSLDGVDDDFLIGHLNASFTRLIAGCARF
jgi:hypothetical protein